ncbi:MAG: hypothetical protein ACK5RO_00150 [Pseudobdellovibrionaceae bacterium]
MAVSCGHGGESFLMDPFYNDYFKDLFTYLKENPLSDSAKLKVRCSRLLIH